MKLLNFLALLLILIGALNWGLWGFFQFDLVAMLFKGNTTMMARVVYSIVGLAGLYSLKTLLCCSKKKCSCGCSSCCKDKGSCGSDSDKGSSGCCK